MLVSGRFRSFALTIPRFIVTFGAAAALAACGGGGGSSSSSSSGGGTGSSGGGTPPTPTGQGLVLPTLLESSVRENFASPNFDSTQYNVTVTDTALEPSNIRLMGADAANFEIRTLIGDTSNPNVFSTELDFGNSRFFDFENPEDANGDNIYNFSYVFDYGETTYEIPIEITVENVREGVPLDASVVRIEFEPTNVEIVPDVTGDSLSEVILTDDENRSFSPGISILSSETINSSLGIYNSILDTDLLARFTPAINGFEKLTSEPSADGQGFDLLFSNTGSDRFTYYDVNGASDSAFLAGDVDPDDAANNGSDYVSDNINQSIDAQIIYDVNLDGQNDIFVYDARFGGMGIRFGTAGNSQLDQSSNPDITITNDDLAGVQPFRNIDIATSPDLDGDGVRELMIISPEYLGGAGNDGNGAVWIINSTYLATNPATIDLNSEAANSVNVRQIIGDFDQRFGASYTELTDGNGDPFLLFGTGESTENQGLIGVSLANFTSLPQATDASNLAAVGATYVLGTDENTGIITNQAIGAITPISDFDGDGQADFLSLNSVLVTAADLLAGANVIGGEHVIELSSAPILGLGNSVFGTLNIFYLEDQGLIGYSYLTSESEIFLLSADDLATAIGSGEGDILVNRPL